MPISKYRRRYKMKIVTDIKDAPVKEEEETEETEFEKNIRLNLEKKKRMEEDRRKANKGVIRSHHLKK